MSEQKPKSYKTEWTFSFEEAGQRFNRWLGSISGDEEVKTARFQEPVGAAASARVELGLSLGAAVVKALSGPGNLIEAEVKYVGEIEFSAAGEPEKRISLRQKWQGSEIARPVKEAVSAFAKRSELRWEVGLTPTIPLSLDIDAGVGPASLDLTGLQLTSLKVDSGVGEIRVTLPATGKRYDAVIHSGVGHTVITIAEGAAVKVHVSGGLGGVDVRLPAGAAARIEADGGIGSVSVPSSFRRISGENDFISQSGVWETAGFAIAAAQIVIDYDGGVGSLKVS